MVCFKNDRIIMAQIQLTHNINMYRFDFKNMNAFDRVGCRPICIDRCLRMEPA